MFSNPYAPPSRIDQTTPAQRWYRRLLSVLTNRLSVFYVVGSFVGVIAGVSYRAGFRTALSDTATFNGVIFFAFFALIAATASVIYCPGNHGPKQNFGRLLGGFSFGLLCLLLEPYVNRLGRSHPDYITPALGFLLTLVTGFCVGVVVQMLFKLGSQPSAQLSDLPRNG